MLEPLEPSALSLLPGFDDPVHGLEAPEVAVAGASAPYRWVGIARQDCSYEPEPATPRSVME